MDIISLRNGSKEMAPIVKVVMTIINELANKGLPGMLLIYDLAEVCRGKDYTPSRQNLEQLILLKLLQENGMPQSSIRNVVLSAVQGEGLDMTIVSPIDPSLKPEISIEQEECGLDKKEYFQRVANIARYILLVGNQGAKSIEDRLQDVVKHGTNPFYSVVPADGSLLLEMYYGNPSCFHTPLGKFDFSGSSSGNNTELVKDLTLRLGLIEVVPKEVNNMGVFGPIYAVTKDLESKPFPMPKIPIPRIKLDYDGVKKEWELVKPDLEIANSAAQKIE